MSLKAEYVGVRLTELEFIFWLMMYRSGVE